jgi:cell division protein FtsB
MDAERKIYGLLETVEQQQKSLEIAAQALEATREALRALVDEIHLAATHGASVAAAQAVAELVAGAAAPTVKHLNQIATSAAGVESKFRRAAAWVTWQHLALVAAGCASLVLAVWVAVSWQRQELTELRDQKAALEAQIAPLQSTVDELVQKGGRIKFNVCGNDRRKCAKVNLGMGTFAKGGENYMILDGY